MSFLASVRKLVSPSFTGGLVSSVSSSVSKLISQQVAFASTYKLKTKSTFKKRFSQTGSGLLKCKPPGNQHSAEAKTKAQRRRKGLDLIIQKVDMPKLKPLMPYGLR